MRSILIFIILIPCAVFKAKNYKTEYSIYIIHTYTKPEVYSDMLMINLIEASN